MPIQIACPECGKKYRFPDERAGSTVECKDCGGDIDLPGEGRRKTKSRDDEGSPSRPRSRKKGRVSKSSGAPVGLILAGGIGGLVVVAVLAFVILRRPGGNNAVPVAGTPGASTAASTSSPNTAVAAPAEKKPTVVSKGWKAKVDPPTIPAPTDPIASFKIESKITYARQEHILYPETASPFVLYGDPGPSNKKPRELWNLASGTKVRDVGPLANMHKAGLSADGKLLAWYRFEDNGGLHVFDTEAGRIAVTIPLPAQQVNITTVAIPSPQRLLIASTVHRKLMTWKLPSGEPERTIQLGENAQPGDQMAFSPGGHYAAFTADFLAQSLQIQDLETGELAGTIEFSERMSNKDLIGLAFSPDGAELAAVFGQNHSATSDRVLIWNFANGTNVADFSLPDPDQRPVDSAVGAPSLQWFPDRKRLLQNGRHIIDRDAKKVVYSLPSPLLRFDTKDIRRVLSNTTIASWDGSKGAEALTALELKESDVARAREVAASGGLIIDAKLPKLTAIDRKRATDKSAISGGWKVQPDPGSEAPTLATSIALSDSTGRPRELQFSRPDSARAALRVATGEDDAKALTSGIYPRLVQITGDKRNRRRYDIEPVMCRQNWLELFDLKEGKSVGRVEIGFPCELVALSPSGSRALVTPMDGQGRLDVFTVPEGTHVAGCRPFVNEEKPEHRDIEAAAFLDENTIAACSRNDQLVVYKLPGCTPVYAVQDAGILAVSPGGKLLATCAEMRIEIRDSLTGEGRGSVPIDGQAVAMSFAPKGDRLAVVTSAGNVSQLNVIELKDGSLTNFPIPAALGPVIWGGGQQLLVGAEKPSPLIHRKSKPSTLDRHLMLVDLKRQAVLWSYDYGTGDAVTFGRKTTDNHLWVAGAAKKGGSMKLTALTVPETSIANRLDDKSLDAKLVVKPGMSVSLQSSLTDPVEAPGVAQQIRDVIDSAARTNGLSIQDSQPLKLTVTATVANDQGMIEMQLFGGPGNQPNKVTVQPKSLTIRMAYELNGKSIWESKRSIANTGTGFVQIGNKQPQLALDEQMWRQAVEVFREIQPTSQVFAGATIKGLGSSRLYGDGAFPPD
ncbi:MAG: hypothetical protein JWP89_4269 [Schlesneria sp.]|nr:hypothetical protein [Schlesneria sp.]